MSRALSFEGYSDDTFGYGDSAGRGDDYDNCASMEPIVWKIEDDPGVGLLVVGHYGQRGVAAWTVGVEPLDDDKGLPPWPISIKQGECSYSPCLEIEVPQFVAVHLVSRRERS